MTKFFDHPSLNSLFQPEKRSYYGVFQHVPGYLEDGRDKKNYFWFLNNDPLSDEDLLEYS